MKGKKKSGGKNDNKNFNVKISEDDGQNIILDVKDEDDEEEIDNKEKIDNNNKSKFDTEREILLPNKKNNTKNNNKNNDLLDSNCKLLENINIELIDINNINNDGKDINTKETEEEKILSAFKEGLEIKIKKNETDKSKGNKIESEEAHVLLKKGAIIDIKDFEIFPIRRKKIVNNIFNYFGIKTNPDYELHDYVIFMDECFVYFSLDKIINKYDISLRRIKNFFSLFDVKHIKAEKLTSDEYKIEFEIRFIDYNKENLIGYKTKEIFLDSAYYNMFIRCLREKLDIYGITISPKKQKKINIIITIFIILTFGLGNIYSS